MSRHEDIETAFLTTLRLYCTVACVHSIYLGMDFITRCGSPRADLRTRVRFLRDPQFRNRSDEGHAVIYSTCVLTRFK